MGRRLDHADIKRRGKEGQKPATIARELKCDPTYVRMILAGRIITAEERKRRGLKSVSRAVQGSLEGRQTRGMPAFDHPAVLGSKTLHPTTVVDPDASRAQMLKPGQYSAKIGGIIRKGRWKNYRVYTLTLEERATCPKSCHHWRSCFGNNMPNSVRYRHGPELEARLAVEIGELCRVFPQGVAIRLHVLGDFYSVEYVGFWERMLAEHPNLVAFGFTARNDRHHDPVADAIYRLRWAQWERFAIRGSNSPMPTKSTISIEHPYQIEGQADVIACPEQLGKTESCSTCALCWQTTKRIAFVQH